MENGFIFKNGELEFVGAVSLSMGRGMEMVTRYAYDYSRRAQGIAWRKYPTARTGTVTIAFDRMQAPDLFGAIAAYEAAAGKVGRLVWNGREQGQFLIRGVQISAAPDGLDIIAACQVGIDIVEAYEPKNRAAPRITIQL